MYKIYINDKVIVFADSSEELAKNSPSYTINYESTNSILESLDDVEKSKEVIIKSDNVDKLFKDFSQKFKLIEASGGLVKNNEQQFLFIFRKGKWDLPKGKIDKGESIENAALREVKEECGINDLKLINPLTETYHTYTEKGKNILKKTYWFMMESEDKNLSPQIEEGITEAVWLPKERFHIVEQNTYPLILDVIDYIE
jgi:8-oxo-dGTP pyrophosphatase MutT (NUDIX family)